MIIFGPLEIVVPILLVFLIVAVVVFVVAFVAGKLEEKNILEKAMVVYPETLFEDITEMKRVHILRLYSKRVDKMLFVITSSEISEEYKDGVFISYAGKTPTILKAKKTTLKEFISNVPEINYKSMITRKGYQTRIEHKPLVIKNNDEPAINHYSDVGFIVKPGETLNLRAQFESMVHDFEQVTVQDPTFGECDYKVYKLGDIRYCVQNIKNNNRCVFLSLGHENKNISIFDEKLMAYAPEKPGFDFPTIKVTKDSLTFWFSCLNLYAANLDKTGPIKLKISAFANFLQVRDAMSEEQKASKDLKFADECYIMRNSKGTTSFVSGIITEVNLKINEFTRDRYWAIDIDCLGTHIRVLADYRLVKSTELKVGRVLCGEMWNTAFLVD